MRGGHTRLREWVLVTLLAIAAVSGFFVFAFSMRYGGPGGLMLRIRAEIAARRPHSEFVPTPLPLDAEAVVAWKRGETSGTANIGSRAVLSLDLTQENSRPALTITPVPQSLADPIHRPALASIELVGFNHLWQTWNNCGPATLAMNMSYFGARLDQAEVAAVLKPNRDDKNVSPEEMADFARIRGLNAVVRVNGDSDRLRMLLSNGIPVLIETWLEPEPGDGMGHYRLLTGYDDATQMWTAYDSYVSAGVDPNQPYRGIRLAYADMEPLWAVFNHTYLVIFSDDQSSIVQSILAEDLDDTAMWRRALEQAQAEVDARADDPFAWFNLGSDLVVAGRYQEAAAAYDRARVIGLPWRMLWYQFGPFYAYYEAGRFQELNLLTDVTIRSAGGNIEELYYWRGIGLAAQHDKVGARQAWQKAVELNPNYAPAAAALDGLDHLRPEGRQVEQASVDGGG